MPSIEHHGEKSFRIKPDDDKLFSKLLSRESTTKSSFRVYYGDVSSTVPFVWETRPGTPKHNSAGDYQIPPLTPPPSYFATDAATSSKSSSRSMLLLHSLLRRISSKRGAAAVSHSSSSSLSSVSWSSSSRSSFSDPLSTPSYVRKRRRFSNWRSSFDERADSDGVRSPRLCFGIGGGEKSSRGSGRSGSTVKRALLSIVSGRGSN